MTDDNNDVILLIFITILLFFILEYILVNFVRKQFPCEEIDRLTDCITSNKRMILIILVISVLVGKYIICELNNVDFNNNSRYEVRHREMPISPYNSKTTVKSHDTLSKIFPTNLVTFSDQPIQFGDLNI